MVQLNKKVRCQIIKIISMAMKIDRSLSYENVLENSDALQLICRYELFGLITFRE